MRQVLQSLSTGATELADVPCPSVGAGRVLIRTSVSLVSAGTERMLVEFGKASLIEKARQQPDKVRQVFDKIKTDGLIPTLTAVRSKLDQPIALGYCNVGRVLEVGQGVEDISVGDRVLSNGPHAEVVCVPKNLCIKIPDNVSDDSAAFGVLGAIGLQGIRLAEPTLGESFVVSGLGLIGLLTAQLLKAHGCRVLGLDYSPSRLELADKLGVDTFNLGSGSDPVSAAMAFSRGRGVDGVIISASTDSNEPIHQAAQMCRRRGRIVLVGVVGLKLSRADFYEKELSFQVSCSYGPGRYDDDYEQRGIDYPFGLVRWTERRNFEAVLDMVSSGSIDPSMLVSHRFPITSALDAYELISSKQPSLGVMIDYPEPRIVHDIDLRSQSVKLFVTENVEKSSHPKVAFIGSGNYASQILIPAFQKSGAKLACVGSRNGLTAALAAKKFHFDEATSNLESIFTDSEIDTVVIATRHDSHAELACRALETGKNVFVEKPLALNVFELDHVLATYQRVVQERAHCPPILTVGFNRRFAPHVKRIKSLLDELNEPKSFIMIVNAGAIPREHWVHDPKVGGGRVVGEACHFIDLLRYLCGSPIIAVHSTKMGNSDTLDVRDDKLTMTLNFADGSFGTIHYLANGHRSIGKERLEVFCAGRVIQLDNFCKLSAVGWKGFRKMNLWSQDKGHQAEVRAFLEAIASHGPLPIPLSEIAEVTRVSFAAVEAAETNRVVNCTTTTLNDSIHQYNNLESQSIKTA